MINIGICDDEQASCSKIEEYLLEIEQVFGITIEIKIWYSGAELCRYLKNKNYLDMIFLDIELVEGNGIEIGKFVRNDLNDYCTMIVYISHEPNYAMQLFQIQPMDFLIKPIKKEYIISVMSRYIKQNCNSTLKFEFKKGHKYYKIQYDEILYFQSMNRKIIIHTQKGEVEFYGKLKEVQKVVPQIFIQIHKSYVINRNYVCEYRQKNVRLQNGEVISISKPYQNIVKQQLRLEIP